MSHTIEVGATPITSVPAIEAMAAGLCKQGIRCSVQKNAKARMYFENQITNQVYAKRAERKGSPLVFGADPEVCPLVLKLEDSPYDVAFIPTEDGAYIPFFDPWKGHIARQLGFLDVTDDEATHHLGRMLQGYTKAAVTQQLEAEGFSVTSIAFDAQGELVIEAENFASL